ncbi:MAG: hypothetical protein OHK0021_02000 [Bryobacter sp.]|nr:hypothetical protein [Bryobacter sp.]
MKGKKKIQIALPKAKKRNPAARVVNQKAPILEEGPKRMGTRRARETKDIEDHAE